LFWTSIRFMTDAWWKHDGRGPTMSNICCFHWRELFLCYFNMFVPSELWLWYDVVSTPCFRLIETVEPKIADRFGSRLARLGQRLGHHPLRQRMLYSAARFYKQKTRTEGARKSQGNHSQSSLWQSSLWYRIIMIIAYQWISYYVSLHYSLLLRLAVCDGFRSSKCRQGRIVVFCLLALENAMRMLRFTLSIYIYSRLLKNDLRSEGLELESCVNSLLDILFQRCQKLQGRLTCNACGLSGA
jgi:hypothetical protein